MLTGDNEGTRAIAERVVNMGMNLAVTGNAMRLSPMKPTGSSTPEYHYHNVQYR